MGIAGERDLITPSQQRKGVDRCRRSGDIAMTELRQLCRPKASQSQEVERAPELATARLHDTRQVQECGCRESIQRRAITVLYTTAACRCPVGRFGQIGRREGNKQRPQLIRGAEMKLGTDQGQRWCHWLG